MSSPLLHRVAGLRVFAAFALLCGLTACESDRGSRRGPRSAEADAAAVPPAPDMEAHGSFFAGQIEAEVLLGRDGFAARDAAKGDTGGGREGRGRSGFSGSLGGLGMGGGGGGGGRRGGGRRSGGEDGASEPSASRGAASQSNDGAPVIHITPSNLPPVRLHLRLTNHGSAPVEVEVPDFNSDLGNFVVQPPKILLLPNQPTEADPMISRLGVGSDEIPLAVAIRANAHVEKQVLVLRIVKPAIPPPVAASAGPPAAAP